MMTVRHIAAEEICREEFSRAFTRMFLHSPAPQGCATRIAAWCHAIIDRIAPYGYEDETGFHYGISPEHDGEPSDW